MYRPLGFSAIMDDDDEEDEDEDDDDDSVEEEDGDEDDDETIDDDEDINGIAEMIPDDAMEANVNPVVQANVVGDDNDDEDVGNDYDFVEPNQMAYQPGSLPQGYYVYQ